MKDKRDENNKPEEGRIQDPVTQDQAYVNNELLLQPDHEYTVQKNSFNFDLDFTVT